MSPVLFVALGVPVPSYGVFVGLGFLAAFFVRRAEKRRLGFASDPRHRIVGIAALLGAMVGSKLGMLLFEPPDAFAATLRRMLSLDFSGKTVVGGLIGGYLAVELAKRLVGIRHPTGDAFAVALPVAQGIGRIGCFLHGCCYGAPTEGPLGVALHGVSRHPAALYEAGLDLLLAAGLFALRDKGLVPGHLFRLYLVGYATIRFVCEFFRGDPTIHLGPLTAVQWVCLLALVGFGSALLGGPIQARRQATAAARSAAIRVDDR